MNDDLRSEASDDDLRPEVLSHDLRLCGRSPFRAGGADGGTISNLRFVNVRKFSWPGMRKAKDE